MTKDRFYLAFAVAVMMLYLTAQLRGWTFTDVDEVKEVPRTVRDNPGSYRQHYAAHYHYIGGK
ncbi:MAG: hypothetical protein HY303_16435 [Candidatus Wallbacteria bacterium]|nr:hypothetical protein [Candidatus Wallbacteria bacterium]